MSAIKVTYSLKYNYSNGNLNDSLDYYVPEQVKKTRPITEILLIEITNKPLGLKKKELLCQGKYITTSYSSFNSWITYTLS